MSKCLKWPTNQESKGLYPWGATSTKTTHTNGKGPLFTKKWVPIFTKFVHVDVNLVWRIFKKSEILFLKLCTWTVEAGPNFPILNPKHCSSQSSFMQTQQLACVLHSKIKRYSLHSKIKVLYDSLSWIMSSVWPLHHKIWLPESDLNLNWSNFNPNWMTGWSLSF